MSNILHGCDEAQRAAPDKTGHRSKAHCVPAHRDKREIGNGSADFLGCAA